MQALAQQGGSLWALVRLLASGWLREFDRGARGGSLAGLRGSAGAAQAALSRAFGWQGSGGL